MLSNEISAIVSEIIPVYRDFVCGEYAIALAGAHAKGVADVNSDLDMFIYTEGIQPYSFRKALIENIADNDDIYISEEIDKEPWGGIIDFFYKGYKIETNVRDIKNVRNVVDECLQGKIKIFPASWTLHGYYNYVYLSEIDFIKPLEDAYKVVYNLKQKLKSYPLNLKKTIINEFWCKSNQWLNNFHYISAINRMDSIYTSGIVQQTFHSIVQVLFALNEKYFSGDKKIEKQLSDLAFCPRCLIENIEFLLASNKKVNLLQQQRRILCDTVSEIEVEIKKL